MNLQDLLWHFLNFAAPVLALAVLLPLLSRLFTKKSYLLLGGWGQVLVNFVVGVAAQLAALWWLGRDGKMMGYALLVLAVTTSQWLMVRGWRR